MPNRIDGMPSAGRRMANTYRRILRGTSANYPYWIVLPEEKCVGQNYHELRTFCDERGLSLSRHGHTVVWEHNFDQVFMFATDQDAEIFRAAFDGERMPPSEKGKGKHWSNWRRGTYKPKRN
jgi:hypothetical protein